MQISANISGGLASSAEKKKMASIREKVAKEMYDGLSSEDKAHWLGVAKEDHEVALAKWKVDLEAPPSEAPADRQRYVYSQ